MTRLREAFIAANRFGLGARPGQLPTLASDPRGWLESQLDAEPAFPTAFCTTCGSSLPSMSSTGRYWVVPAGTLEDDPGIEPSRSIFWGSRAPWFRDTGALPHHDELPER